MTVMTVALLGKRLVDIPAGFYNARKGHIMQRQFSLLLCYIILTVHDDHLQMVK
jgi:hypothetical protein